MATTPTEPATHAEPAQPRSWFLTGDELDATRAKIATLNTRARRKGFTGTVELAATAATRSYTPAPGAPAVTVHGFDATVTGQPPCYWGWIFVAAIDLLPAAQPDIPPGVVVRYPPGADQTISNDEVRPGECDHCHTVRPRTTTYLVRNDDTGELLQVGRTCLKDFLGWSTAPVLIDTDTIAADIEASLGTRTTAPWDLESVLTYAWAVVETHGWTPTSAASSGRTPTRDLVADALHGGNVGQRVLAGIRDYLDAAPAMPARIITDLAPTLTADTGYEANLAALLRAGQVDPRHLGLAVSAVNAWHRLHEHQASQRAREQRRDQLRHVGQVGQPITLTGTITTRLPVDGYRYDSPPQLLLILDCGDAVAKMITCAAWAYDTKPGEQLTVTGTVKAHTEYCGVPQTVLVRPRRVDTTAADSPPLWEIVAPLNPQSRFQEAPLAALAPLGRGLGI
ncbi:MAG: hypothetical protein IT193_13020 [Propionibacteriaceae bacterium]|nr:hypothetical protein [Propionibacteriaceae bacterium]